MHIKKKKTALYAATARDRVKTARYAHLARNLSRPDQPVTFVPWSIEPSGAPVEADVLRTGFYLSPRRHTVYTFIDPAGAVFNPIMQPCLWPCN